MTVTLDEQLVRIAQKLTLAGEADSACEVFGARKHRYRLPTKLAEDELTLWEADSGIHLPEEYRVFLLNVSASSDREAPVAGPYYGLLPLSTQNETGGEVGRKAMVRPDMTVEEWLAWEETLDRASDAEYDILCGEMYGGVLSLVDQGCCCWAGLIVTGEHRGRIVYFSEDAAGPPFFCYETNFLDWYERWLDEVIAGDLLRSAAWFGTSRGGSETDLWVGFLAAGSAEDQRDHLIGLRNKRTVSSETLDLVEEALEWCDDHEVRTQLLFVLAKNDYERVRGVLVSGREHLLTVFQAFHWFAQDHLIDAVPLIESTIHEIEDSNSFDFCCYILAELGDQQIVSNLVPPCLGSDNKSIRRQALYTMGKVGIGREHLDHYLRALRDPCVDVVRTAIQAINFTDPQLLAEYERLLEDYPTDEGYIRTNVTSRLNAYGLKYKVSRALGMNG